MRIGGRGTAESRITIKGAFRGTNARDETGLTISSVVRKLADGVRVEWKRGG